METTIDILSDFVRLVNTYIQNMHSKTKHTYRPDIDGLRALAVVAVIFFHFDVPGFSGGYTGVDIFFVISGYLIIRIIINELAAGTFRLTDFWARRIRRIMPALTAVLLVTAAVAYFIMLLPIDLVAFGKTLMAQSLFLSNVWFMGQSSYFAAPAETMPLLHTWTLALEEQFYILFPVLAVLFYRFVSNTKSHLGLLMVTLAGLSFVYGVTLLYGDPDGRFALAGLPHLWGSATNSSAAFYFIVPRLWEFLVGGLIAVYAVTIKNRLSAEVLAWVGLVSIIISVSYLSEASIFPGAVVLIPVFGAAALIVANSSRKTSVGKMLSYRPVVFVGLLSYTLYLWHWPVWVLAQYQSYQLQDISVSYKLLLLVVVSLLSYVTYKYVETPIRERRWLTTNKQLYAAGLLSVVVLFGIGLHLTQANGFPGRVSAQAQQIAAAMEDVNPRRDECFARSSTAVSEGPCLLGEKNPDQIDFVLWGDSHANAAMLAFDTYGEMTGKTGVFFGATGCAPIPSDPPVSDDPECLVELDRAVEYISNQQPAEVFMIAEWKTGYELVGSDQGWFLHALLSSTIDLLPRETQIKVFHRLPSYAGLNLRNLFFESNEKMGDVDLWMPKAQFVAAHAEFVAQIEQVVSEHDNAQAIDPFETLCDEERCYLGTDTGLYVSDGSHLSTYGAQEIILPLLLMNAE